MGGCTDTLVNYQLSNADKVITKSSSKGAQVKYYKDGYWYKEDRGGYQGLSEYLISMLLTHTNVKDYVVYERCLINGKKGCRSYNFLSEGEEFLTLHRLFKSYYGYELGNEIMKIPDVKDRVNWLIGEVFMMTEVNITTYLQNLFVLDMLTVNTDRHFNNIGLIKNNHGFRAAPIFDNGAGLLSNYSEFPPDVDIEEHIANASSKPFSGSFHQQVLSLGIGLEIDYPRLYNDLSKEKPSRALQALKYQLKQYEHDIPQLGKENIVVQEPIIR